MSNRRKQTFDVRQRDAELAATQLQPPHHGNGREHGNGMQSYHSSFTFMGEVLSIDAGEAAFSLKLLTEDAIRVRVSKTTFYEVLRNVGDESRDRVREPEQTVVEQTVGRRSDAADPALWDAKRQLLKYLKPGLMICIQGIRSQYANTIDYSARRVVLMHSDPGRYEWEDAHWWIQQINTLSEQWLDVLFQDRREFTEHDFAACYRTNLNLLGGITGDSIQECATMSRFLYGLSSAYLLTGNDRALSAARACAQYLVNAFSSTSHNGEYVFWKFGRVKDGNNTREIISSLHPDDYGTFALYEQIYVLAGLAQYYRITQDTWILGYIVRTVAAFERFYRDEERPGDPCYTGQGGYFSHIDPVTQRPDTPSLDATGNREKKNWNSIGDHIPAYLINLIVSLDPIPISDERESWIVLRDLCQKILDDCVINILDHFAPEDGTLFVNERFYKDWSYDHAWGWQQNRGIVGHNLKISWNLTRCANYYVRRVEEARRNGDTDVERKYARLC
jgi:hypothetical protein